MIDSAAYVVGIGGNLAVVPQIISAWQTDGKGLSILTWALFILIGMIWLFYGVAHKSKPLIWAQLLGILTSTLVVIGWSVNHLIK